MSHMVDLVIFGGTGDLSTRKLLPALYQLQRHQLADRLNRIIATGRGELDPESFRNEAHANLKKYLPQDSWDEAVWERFCQRLDYVKLDAGNAANYAKLAELLNQSEAPGPFSLQPGTEAEPGSTAVHSRS
jgi:glucose-6-phosphate 1-dehydrogenase